MCVLEVDGFVFMMCVLWGWVSVCVGKHIGSEYVCAYDKLYTVWDICEYVSVYIWTIWCI